MAESDRRPARRRRRVQRPSTAQNYDRSFDAPSTDFRDTAGNVGDDELRSVALDNDGVVGNDDEPTGEGFYRENMPPHFGATQ